MANRIVLIGDGNDGSVGERDIIVRALAGPLTRISALFPCYIPLHYVLLFPDVLNGWHPHIPLNITATEEITQVNYENDQEDEQTIDRHDQDELDNVHNAYCR